MNSSYVLIKYLGSYEQEFYSKTSLDPNLRFQIQMRYDQIHIRSAKRFKIIKKLDIQSNDYTFVISKDSSQIIISTYQSQFVIMEYFNIKHRFELPIMFPRFLKYIDLQQFVSVSTSCQILLYNHINGNQLQKTIIEIDPNTIKLLEVSSINSMIIIISKKQILLLNMELEQVIEGKIMFQQDQPYQFLDDKNEIIEALCDSDIIIYRIDYVNKIIVQQSRLKIQSQNSEIWRISIANELLLIQLQKQNNMRVYKIQNRLNLVYDIKNFLYQGREGCKSQSGCHVIYFEQEQHNSYNIYYESPPISFNNYLKIKSLLIIHLEQNKLQNLILIYLVYFRQTFILLKFILLLFVNLTFPSSNKIDFLDFYSIANQPNCFQILQQVKISICSFSQIYRIYKRHKQPSFTRTYHEQFNCLQFLILRANYHNQELYTKSQRLAVINIKFIFNSK
ncbi:hypothetical protein pb186bvf_020979 [Paramecium bursaria]